ncbi:hypothetical protein CYMTET_36305, partial [Cymbomonas tetramitiformis]
MRCPGEIDEEELTSAFKAFGLNISDQQVHELFAAADSDGSGAIGVTEFLQIMGDVTDKNAVDGIRAMCAGDSLGAHALLNPDKSMEGGVITMLDPSALVILEHEEYKVPTRRPRSPCRRVCCKAASASLICVLWSAPLLRNQGSEQPRALPAGAHLVDDASAASHQQGGGRLQRTSWMI